MSGKKKSNLVLAILFAAVAISVFLATIFIKGGIA